MIESRAVFRRRRFHRAKAHLILSAMRHRAAELGDRCRYLTTTTYAEGLAQVRGPLTVCHPTSRPALEFVEGLPDVEVLPARGYVSTMAEFRAWAEARGRRRLLMEDFYRDARRRLDVLMEGRDPAGGQWNFDHDNREPPPRSGRIDVPAPPMPEEDEIDAEVRRDLDRWAADGEVAFVGDDGPRLFPVTRAESLTRLDHFVRHRLSAFGPIEDAMLAGEPWMAHSMISASQNLGLVDPLEVVRVAEAAYRRGEAPIASVEGFVRQVMGWRDYVWHLYWYEDARYKRSNYLRAQRRLPDWFLDLDDTALDARCLKTVLGDLRRHGWVHHIPRLMVLGNYALQRGWNPTDVTDWFLRSFVDGYDWVMTPNIVGMSQYADGGIMMTKPYASGGAYIDRMSDFCGGCRYDPKKRVGPDACPFTAGYWAFLARNRARLEGNRRTAQQMRTLDRLSDLDEVVAQERRRGSAAP